MVKWMQKFFQYLDRFYVEINSLTPLTDQGYKQFKTVVFGPILHNIISAILDSIHREREGELIDDDLLKKVVEIFLFLSQDNMLQDSLNCRKQLEDKILEQTKSFYQRTCQDLLERESLSGYLQLANKFYNEEKSRCERYLIWDIKEKILAEFRTEMLLTY
jgi:cullin 1